MYQDLLDAFTVLFNTGQARIAAFPYYPTIILNINVPRGYLLQYLSGNTVKPFRIESHFVGISYSSTTGHMRPYNMHTTPHEVSM